MNFLMVLSKAERDARVAAAKERIAKAERNRRAERDARQAKVAKLRKGKS